MIDLLYELPDILIILVFVAFFGGCVALLPRLLVLIPRVRPTAESTDFILRIQSTFFTMTAFVLAFTLVQAQANYRRIEGIVLSEASQINTLDRLLTRYGDPEVASIRPDLLAYAQSIVKDEWPLLDTGDESPETVKAFTKVAREVTGISAAPGRQASLYSEMLKSLDIISEMRDSRLGAARLALPVTYWIVVWLAMGVLVIASAMVVRTRYRTFFLTAQASVLGALMGVVFITDHPMKGQTSVGPDAIVRVIGSMKNRST